MAPDADESLAAMRLRSRINLNGTYNVSGTYGLTRACRSFRGPGSR
jgi:hypothetical protein